MSDWQDGLRPYQIEAVDAVCARKVQRGIVAIATGGGKSRCQSVLPEALGITRALYMVHRDTLVDQLAAELRMRGHFVGVEQGDRHASDMAPIVVASTQTLTASGGRRLSKLVARDFELFAMDEAHHGTSETACRVMAGLGLLRPGSIERDHVTRKRLEPKWVKTDNPPTYCTAWTATPHRGDGVGLHLVFDDIIYKKELATLIREGWLVPVIPYQIRTGTSLDNVETYGPHGDYKENQLEAAINTDERNDAVLDGWRKGASGLKTLGFAATIAHAEALAAHFNGSGIPSWAIHGGLSKDAQRDAFRKFSDMAGAVMWSCQLVGEGVDLPHVEAILLARPTRSGVVLAQSTGRGTRLAAGARDYADSVRLGKSHVVVLDVTDSLSSRGKKALRIGSLFGATWPDEIQDGQDILVQVEAQEEKQKDEIRIKDRAASLTAVKLMDTSSLPRHFGLAWLQAGDAFLLPLPDGGLLRLSTDTLDRWAVERREGKEWKPFELAKAAPKQEAVVKAAETWYRATYQEVAIIADRSAAWRARPASDAQKRFGNSLIANLTGRETSGELADKITAAQAALGKVRAYKPKERPIGEGPCPMCQGPMTQRHGKFGAFFGCNSYPECRGIRNIVAQPAEMRA